MLRWGVTSVRLMAEDVAAARALGARAVRPGSGMPDVFPSGPIFTTKGGWWGRGEPPDANLDRFPATPEEARAAVRKARALGAQEIKLMLDDMAWCRAPLPALPKVDPAIARAILEEARRQSLRASVHAPGLADAEAAIASRATALAHGVLEPIPAEIVGKMKTPPDLLHPDDGRLRVPGRRARVRGRGALGSAGGGRSPEGDGRAPPFGRVLGRLPGEVSEFREREEPAAGPARKPAPAPRRGSSRRPRDGHVGLPRARRLRRARPLRQGRHSRPSRRSGPPRRPRRARSRSTATPGPSRPASRPTSWCSRRTRSST